MPLPEGSYLPPAAFVLSHVLGIAGVLYWRSRSGAGRGSGGPGGAVGAARCLHSALPGGFGAGGPAPLFVSVRTPHVVAFC